MIRHSLPDPACAWPHRIANYSLADQPRVQSAPPDAAVIETLVAAYADVFAYGTGPSGNREAMEEGLLRIAVRSAALEAHIAPLWHALGASALTVAQDADKQRADRLFGLDGKAGVLGALKRHRSRAETLPMRSGAQQARFLAELIGFAGMFLPAPTARGSVDLWAGQRPAATAHPGAFRLPVTMALPIYLQALALVVLVQGWIGGSPGAAEQAELAQHRAFLIGEEGRMEWSLLARFFAGGDCRQAAALKAAACALMLY